ncbi:hypothetical protein [Streptococcus anginosus]|uniref:Uncharacterized protein n=2 Tax=Streptococcus anginosus TaxID=1328 RepID=I0SKZ9_STRAP|nr:hypothetical protein [Streptococcus anginosus]AGU83672.1 hypothetical protein SANR_1226 [Streptococcus anginosus C238]EID24052.1 hypothetical protein HMPREF1043_0365 [Streptococcus anginosus subsp. whileyi CCUG 39159]MDB8660692.1 hypothetical protein [Streptococcus anginosus]MDP1383992.1 hypothetical protein [Streptococcus anginosus]QQT08073.1 hypothetical protein I6J12_05520 [Streptococcus anginosus]
MSNNSDKIKNFFLKLIVKKHSGLNVAYINKVKSYSDDELKMEYSELKSISERKGTIANSLVLVMFLAFLGGLYKLFVDFSNKVTGIYGGSEKSLVLMNGLMFLSITLFVIVSFLILFYFYRVYDKKKKFYYVEVLMKEKGLLG